MHNETRHSYLTLDAMRGIAAILVVTLHAEQRGLIPLRIASNAWISVDLFFVLSGFVIAHAYTRRLFYGLPARIFCLLRFLRFYPLWVLGFSLGLMKELTQLLIGDPNSLSGTEIIIVAGSGFLFLPVLGGTMLFPLNHPMWSLFWEMIINIVYAVFFRNFTVKILIFCVVVGAIGLLTAAFVFGNLAGGYAWRNAWVAVPRIVYSFSVGILIYQFRGSLPKSLGRIPAFVPLIILMVCLAVPTNWVYQPIYDILFVLVISPSLVALASFIEPNGQEKSWFSFLGAISFPLYALHFPFMDPVARLSKSITGVPPTAIMLLFLSMLCIACWYVNRVDILLRRFLLGRLLPEYASPKR